MSNIIKEILKFLPEGRIASASYEGANIVLYTSDRNFLTNGVSFVRKAVNTFKKRIELRADPSIVVDMETAKNQISSLIPKEAKLSQINFDPPRSLVIIEAEKPGLAIGKQGAILNDIKEKTLWTPIIKRSPPIRSKIVEDIRTVLYQSSDEVKKILNRVGERVYNGWIRGKKDEWVRVTFLGGAHQVGRSAIFLQTPESRILLDCGIDVSRDTMDAFPILKAPEFDISELDAVIVSHAHMDHSGFIPALYRYGYTGPVYCTPPTRDIMTLSQLDYIKIMFGSGSEPIYNADDVKEMLKHTVILDYDVVSDITPDVRITFYKAGHILGSSMVHVHIGNGLHNLLYTGDFKFIKTELLDPAVSSFQRVESIITESTYGGRNDRLSRRIDSENQLVEAVNKTIERGGKTLIPVLGVGRAQEVMLIVEKAIQEGKLKNLPIYIDGLVWDITAIHTAYPEYLSARIRNKIFNYDNNPFLSPVFKRVGSSTERKQIIEAPGPAIIVATSGMLTGGSSVLYLRELADDPKNSIVFVSYQAQNTLGRRIEMGEKEFSFKDNGETRFVRINLEVNVINGLSGHADRTELENFFRLLTPKPKKAIVVHGEPSKSKELATYLSRKYHMETHVPKNLESIRLV